MSLYMYMCRCRCICLCLAEALLCRLLCQVLPRGLSFETVASTLPHNKKEQKRPQEKDTSDPEKKDTSDSPSGSDIPICLCITRYLCFGCACSSLIMQILAKRVSCQTDAGRLARCYQRSLHRYLRKTVNNICTATAEAPRTVMKLIACRSEMNILKVGHSNKGALIHQNRTLTYRTEPQGAESIIIRQILVKIFLLFSEPWSWSPGRQNVLCPMLHMPTPRSCQIRKLKHSSAQGCRL